MPDHTDKRVRKFADLLANLRTDVQDLKQTRPPAASTTKFVTIAEDGVGLDDTITTSAVTNPTFCYDDPRRGYDFGEYADEYASGTGSSFDSSSYDEDSY